LPKYLWHQALAQNWLSRNLYFGGIKDATFWIQENSPITGMIDQNKKLLFPPMSTIVFSNLFPKFLRQVLANKRPDFSGLAVVAIATLVTSGAVLGVRHFHGLEPLELAIFDQMIRLRPEEAPDPRIVVVGITEQDIQKLQKWPISDEIMAQLFFELQSHQPEFFGLVIYRHLP